MYSRFLLTTFAVVMFVPVGRTADPIPTDLALIPPDAIGFMHIRARDLWASDLMKGLRDTVDKAGAKAIMAFDNQFYPAPSTIDRFTVIAITPATGQRVPTFIYVLRFTSVVDATKLKTLYFPGRTIVVAGKSIMSDEHQELSAYLADGQTVVFGQGTDLTLALTRKATSSSRLAGSLGLAASGKNAVTMAVNPAMIPDYDRMIADAPKEFLPLLKMDSMALSIVVAQGNLRIGLNANYGTDANAMEAEQSFKSLTAIGKVQLASARKEMEAKLFEQPMGQLKVKPLSQLPEAGGMLVGIGAMNQFEEMLDQLPIKKTGTELVADFTVPKEVAGFVGIYSAGLGMMLPAVQKVREAAARTKGSNNLKQIGLAMHNYHDTYTYLPSATPKMSENPPQDFNKRLSWRVAILPYIEQENLYRQFKLDEPWDSEHNKKLIPLMPQIFVDPRASAPAGKTYYKVFTGKEALFDKGNRGARFADVTDGLSNTIMVIAGGDPVDWTKPEDIEFDSKKDLPDLGKPFGGLVTVLMADGSVRTINLEKLKKDVLKAMVTKAGGEVFSIDE